MAEQNERSLGLEIVSAIILSVAALASSLAVYQAGLWDGQQALHYSRANALRIVGSRSALEGDALAAVEVQMFGAWLEAWARNDQRVATFYRARFPPSFKPAFNEWIAADPLNNPSAPATPFVTPAYRRPGLEQSRAYDRQAEASFAAGHYANAVSDSFQQSATMLAVALFFAGIGQVFTQKKTRVALVAVAGVVLIIGLLRLFSLPMEILGLHAAG
ncbi:hypothetical protein LJR219_002230 [Phenylobacterium sp. LjRoot219]|uniref:hypothetical protein n=1 Tax=Phenylobacterium sp. LjRoot219 TaxID=3342283 RepID=UPI003ECC296A